MVNLKSTSPQKNKDKLVYELSEDYMLLLDPLIRKLRGSVNVVNM